MESNTPWSHYNLSPNPYLTSYLVMEDPIMNDSPSNRRNLICREDFFILRCLLINETLFTFLDVSLIQQFDGDHQIQVQVQD
jgi:hypothetical protein